MGKLHTKFVLCLAIILLRLSKGVYALIVKMTKMLIERKILVKGIWRMYWLIRFRSVTSGILQDDLSSSGMVLKSTVRL